jgi:hypothetical protein
MPVSLPIIRLVRERLTPQAGLAEVAEVMLSGLIQRISAYDPTQHPDNLLYDFVEDARAALQHRMLNRDVVRGLEVISAYVSEHIGLAFDFQTWIADPTGASEFPISEDSRPFAEIASAVLHRLGGRFGQLATKIDEKLDGVNGPDKKEDKPPPFGPLDTDTNILAEPDLPRKPFEPETVLVPGGPFLMGSDDQIEESPAHQVILPTYRIGKFPVTNREYAEYVKQMPT